MSDNKERAKALEHLIKMIGHMSSEDDFELDEKSSDGDRVPVAPDHQSNNGGEQEKLSVDTELNDLGKVKFSQAEHDSETEKELKEHPWMSRDVASKISADHLSKKFSSGKVSAGHLSERNVSSEEAKSSGGGKLRQSEEMTGDAKSSEDPLLRYYRSQGLGEF